MKNGLNKRAIIGDCFDNVNVNIYDIETKSIIFTGTQKDAVKFLGMGNVGQIKNYIKNKYRFRKKYAIRLAPDKQQK